MATGTVKTIVGDKGFGFITMEGSPDVFFHHSECDNKFEEMTPGTQVQFEVTQGDKGPKAVKVTMAPAA